MHTDQQTPACNSAKHIQLILANVPRRLPSMKIDGLWLVWKPAEPPAQVLRTPWPLGRFQRVDVSSAPPTGLCKQHLRPPLQLPNSRRYIKTPGLGPLQPCPQDAATRAVVLSVQPPLVPFAYCHAPPTRSLCNSTASQGPACASEHQVTPPHSRPAPIVGAGEVAARPTVPHSACSTIGHSHQFVRRRAG